MPNIIVDKSENKTCSFVMLFHNVTYYPICTFKATVETDLGETRQLDNLTNFTVMSSFRKSVTRQKSEFCRDTEFQETSYLDNLTIFTEMSSLCKSVIRQKSDF